MSVNGFRVAAAARVLRGCTPESSPLQWPSPALNGSALPWSPLGANISTLQDSLHGTGCWVAPPLRRESSASPHPVARMQREPATWLSGDYHDRTCTSKLLVPFRAHQRVVRSSCNFGLGTSGLYGNFVALKLGEARSILGLEIRIALKVSKVAGRSKESFAKVEDEYEG